MPTALSLSFLAYAYAHTGTSTWLAHMVVSSLVHALIYGVIFKLIHSLGLGGGLLLAMTVIGGIWLVMRQRPPRWHW